MNRTASDTQLRQLAEALGGTGRPHSAAVPAGIDPAALKRAVRLFRSAVFAGYFDAEPIAASLGELSDILCPPERPRLCHIPPRVHPDAEPFGREVAAQR